jgi:hypothetical protein
MLRIAGLHRVRDTRVSYRCPFRSAILTIFWRCGAPYFSFTTGSGPLRQQTVNGFGRGCGLEGVAMLIRSEMVGVHGGAAVAVRSEAIPAASLSTLLLGGLLLLICP